MMVYPENEYDNTHDMRTGSAVVHMIRVQAEQIRETPAEYAARKYGIRGDELGVKGTLREDT